jgi:redox-sensing transcriptional repressor
MVTHRTIGRLTLYWRILRDLGPDNEGHVFSHYIAAKARVTPAQVRRDLMVLGYTGTPAHGYHIRKLREHIEAFVYPSSEQKAAIAGVGNIGRALLKFFNGRRPNLKIVASFETNPEKFGRLMHGCPCHSIDNAESIIREKGITVAIIAVPENEAQFVADAFVSGGVRGILNFARTPLHVPPGVYVEDIDLAMSMDRVSYFSRQSLKADEPAPTVKAIEKESTE